MSDKKLNVAVIGCGIITWRHTEALQKMPEVNLYALCDTAKDDRAEKLKVKYGTPETKIVTDYKDLLGDPQIDAVIITTPDGVHCEQACAFLRDGKPVLLEKPMALKEEECQEMLRCSKETGTMLTVGQVARYSANFTLAKRLIDEGHIGELTFVESEYAHDYALRTGEGDWRKSPDRHGMIGGGCHAIDLLRWIAGDPTEVQAIANHKYLNDWPVDDTCDAIYKFPNDVIGKVFCGIGVKRSYTMRTCIYGTKGTLIFSNYGRILTLYKASPEGFGYTVPHRIPTIPISHNMFAEIKDFIDAVVQGKNPPISPLEGASTVAVACATVKSAQTGKPVKIKYPKY